MTQNIDVRIVFQSVQFSDSFEPIRKAFTLGRNENYEVGDTLQARAFDKTKNNECNKMYFTTKYRVETFENTFERYASNEI